MNVAERVAELIEKFSIFRCRKTDTGGWKVVVHTVLSPLGFEWAKYINDHEFLFGSDRRWSIFKHVKKFGNLTNPELFCSFEGCSLEEIAIKLDLLGFDD